MTDLSRYQYPPQPHYTINECFTDYSREKYVNKGRDPRAPWSCFRGFLRPGLVDPSWPAAAVSAGQVEDFTDAMVAAGRTLATAAKTLTFVKAALVHAKRRKRIAELPEIEIPKSESKWRRPLTEDEFKLVMRQKMSARLRKFYRVAWFTGHRAEAIEQLTWDRVDMERRLIDFNVPGIVSVNKKRCRAFPICEEFAALLDQWRSSNATPYVIGLGVRGRVTSTYHEAAYVVRELAGLKDPTLVPRHCMRKMYATEMFDKQADPEVVGFLLADKPDTLRKHYVKLKESRVRDVAALRSR